MKIRSDAPAVAEHELPTQHNNIQKRKTAEDSFFFYFCEMNPIIKFPYVPPRAIDQTINANGIVCTSPQAGGIESILYEEW